MIIYGIIMFLTAALFGVVAVLIYRGKTDLIHDYHQTKVKDKAAYGKDFGKALAVIAVTLAVSGVTALFGEAAAGGAVAVLVVGLIVGICAIILVQRKHNGGVF